MKSQKMNVLMILSIGFAIFFLFTQFAIAQHDTPSAASTKFTINYNQIGTVNEENPKGWGQCVDFVKYSRNDLKELGIPFGTPKKMINLLKGKDFEVNDIPRVGAALIMPNVGNTPGGHVALVTGVERGETGGYVLTIVDANAKGEAGYDEELNEVTGRGIIRERTILYKDGKTFDEKFTKEQSGIKFVHENLTEYKKKQKQATEYVINVFKEKAGRNPSVEELNMYRTMIFAGENQSEEKLQKYIHTIKGFLAKLKDLSSLDVWNATFGIPIAQAPTTSYGASDSWDDAVTVAQDQTTEGVDNNPTFTSGGNYWGHIALMLTKNGNFEEIYSTLEPTDIASSNISVPSYNSSRVMTMNGTSSPPQITALETSTGAVTVGIPVSIDMYELGNNSYMKWGYWLQNNIMQAGGANYSVDNRGYYLTGDPTTNAQMTNLRAHNNSGTYTGTANGTYWTNTGGTNMSGTFDANVSFASRSLNNINISISGGGHSASISGATATSSGSSSTFISNSDGQWKIDGATLGSSSTNDLRAAVLGPTGKAIGGGFGMGQSVATTGVVIGIFQGTR